MGIFFFKCKLAIFFFIDEEKEIDVLYAFILRHNL